MEDKKDKNPQRNNLLIARRTLTFLGKELRLQQFILKAQSRQRKAFEAAEIETQYKIDCLKNKIQRELDMNPGIFEKIPGEE